MLFSKIIALHIAIQNHLIIKLIGYLRVDSNFMPKTDLLSGDENPLGNPTHSSCTQLECVSEKLKGTQDGITRERIELN